MCVSPEVHWGNWSTFGHIFPHTHHSQSLILRVKTKDNEAENGRVEMRKYFCDTEAFC